MHINTKSFYEFLNMYINSKTFSEFLSPFLSIINKGVKTNQIIKIYMRNIFMKRRDVKLAPPAYMHYMEKG